MGEVRPRADPAEFLQGAGPCSVAAWSMGHRGGVGQDGIGCWGGISSVEFSSAVRRAGPSLVRRTAELDRTRIQLDRSPSWTKSSSANGRAGSNADSARPFAELDQPSWANGRAGSNADSTRPFTELDQCSSANGRAESIGVCVHLVLVTPLPRLHRTHSCFVSIREEDKCQVSEDKLNQGQKGKSVLELRVLEPVDIVESRERDFVMDPTDEERQEHQNGSRKIFGIDRGSEIYRNDRNQTNGPRSMRWLGVSVQNVVSAVQQAECLQKLEVSPCMEAFSTDFESAPRDGSVQLNSSRPLSSFDDQVEFCPELVQFYGFRSVEVLLETPPGSPKNCPEARGGSVRVQISLSRPVSFFMVKPRLCPRQDQSSPLQLCRQLGFGQVFSDQPAAYRGPGLTE
ncbi:hypothetical protein F2Q68_00016225 [Brassica cretica]|uniref:Uncharacterized protein n=1 Tax=Brassica cretica TaxID=69181 RepID=A0A8S9HJN0_BRACR|nr:hypothetical protein F2Q68_00016225 [Brassica cretica]